MTIYLFGSGLLVQYLYICSCLEQIAKLKLRGPPTSDVRKWESIDKTSACVDSILGWCLFAVCGRM